MIRFAAGELDRWLENANRKPLVLRGARQVGKTWLVRDFAERHGLQLIELNFERLPRLADLFEENDPGETLINIEAELAIKISPESSLLFLDEIQAAPELLAKLRWFQEEMPRLAVIAAGSLLEFALNKTGYSMPVGRITFFYLEQMSFFEFMLASGNEALYRKVSAFSLRNKMPPSLHEKCLNLYHDYCLVGGMPEVVREWLDNQDFENCMKLQQDLLATYRDDFHKYGGEIDARLLTNIMLSVAEQLGSKFIYTRVDPSQNIQPVKKALELLFQAKVCAKILHTTGNRLPLGAETNEKFFKALMLDIGLVSAQLGLSSISRPELKKLVFSNKGGLTEQFVGQQLRAAQTPLHNPQLYYWQRTGGRQGEIDYIIQHGHRVVPVEVKSGSAGSMKSLHHFMAEKNLDLAVRLSAGLPADEVINVKTTMGRPVVYRMLSIPAYMTENIEKLINRTGPAEPAVKVI